MLRCALLDNFCSYNPRSFIDNQAYLQSRLSFYLRRLRCTMTGVAIEKVTFEEFTWCGFQPAWDEIYSAFLGILHRWINPLSQVAPYYQPSCKVMLSRKHAIWPALPMSFHDTQLVKHLSLPHFYPSIPLSSNVFFFLHFLISSIVISKCAGLPPKV